MPFKIHDLTASALEWARNEIGYYPGGLRDELLARDWTSARLFAWLPSDLPAELKRPFDASFIERLGREHAMDWTYTAAEIGYVQSHLLRTQFGVFLYQADYLRLSRGHPIAKAQGESLLAFELGSRAPGGEREEAWVYMDRGFEESESITLTMHRGKWPQHGLGVLTSLTNGLPSLETSELVGPHVMAELAARTTALLVPAWRGNAFIFVEFPRIESTC